MIRRPRQLVLCLLLLTATPCPALAEIVRVADSQIKVGIDDASGTIRELLELPAGFNQIAEAAATLGLWQITVDARNSAKTISAEKAGPIRFERLSGARPGLQLVWDRVDAGAESPLRVEVRVHLGEPRPGLSRWELVITKPAGLRLTQVRFPRVGGLRERPDETLAVPKVLGLLHRQPRTLLQGKGSQGARIAWGYPFPLVCQCLAFYQPDGPGFYAACDDTAGFRKEFAVWGDGKGQINFEISHEPEQSGIGAAEFRLPFSAVLGTFRGDWSTAAQIYRQSPTAQAYLQRGRLARETVPAWLPETGLWVWNRGRSPQVLDPAVALRKHLQAPVSVLWHWWHNCPYDAGFPEYLPPREGTLPFTAALAKARNNDVHALLYMNQRLWGVQTESWSREGAEAYAVKGKNGKVRAEVYNTFMKAPCAPLCIGTRFWRDKYAGLAEEALCNLKADGVYMDQTGVMASCYDERHGHILGPGRYWTDGLDRLVTDIRQRTAARGPVALGGEYCGEPWIDSVDLSLGLNVAADRMGGEGGWETIPFYMAVYHASTIVFGNMAGLVHPPYDEKWPANLAPQVCLTPLDRKFGKQFCLEHARTLVWGMQPMVANFLPDQLEKWPAEMDFLTRLVRTRMRALKYLLHGTWLRPPQLDVPKTEIDVAALGTYTLLKDSKRTYPTVLAGAWRAADGDVAIALASIHDNKLSIEVPIDAKAYGLPAGCSIHRIDHAGRRDATRFDPRNPTVRVELPARGVLLLEFSGQGLCVAEDGRSNYRIVIAKAALPSTRYAAEELQKHLKQICGAELPIVDDTQPAQPHEILVGRSSRLKELGLTIDFAALGQEGYVLRTDGTHLVIAGGEPRGTLYGVYGLLEDHLGCRWFTPEIQRIPKQSRLTLPPLDERRTPVFEYRETYTWESYDADWMARNRLNGAGGRGRLLERQGIRLPVPELEARHGGGIRFGFGFFVHTMEKIVPAGKYFAAHPEYFAIWKGKRDPAQVCCSNEDVIRLCTDGILAAMREQPDATVFSLSQNDNGKYCQCEQCDAIAKAEGTKMGPLLHLVNRVAEATEKEFPDKLVETLAYQWSRQPPKILRPRRNVVIRLCDIECCFAHPLASGCTARNATFVADLQAWSRACQRLWVWDYTTNYANYLLPLPNKRLLDANIRLFAENGVAGVFEQGTYDTFDSEMAALKAYLIAKFLWNPHYDRRRASSEFLNAYYGPAADAIQAYLDLIHDFAEQKPVHVGIYAAPTNGNMPPGVLAQASTLWDHAETLTQQLPDALDRVRRSRMSVDYAIVEQARAAMKLPKEKRTAEQRSLIDLARRRFEPFMRTMASSKITRLREWKDYDKAEYRAKLAADLELRFDDSARQEAHRKAKQFLDNEKQFHLGVLPTEQPHPETVGLAEKAQHDLEGAVRMLQAVESDIPHKVARVFKSQEYERLVAAMRGALRGNGRICFSGCGATGRLSILLEACWRRYFHDAKRESNGKSGVPDLEDRVISITTGGDYALVRSVENFEDHAAFGRQQVREAGLGKGDVLVAISEGGETSSVIGTIHQALDNGAQVFFLFNNPAEILARHIERSRQVIEDPRVTVLDLTTGPMAVAGSTRMQATTTELLVAGAALETALIDVLNTARVEDRTATPDYAKTFSHLLDDLGKPESVAALAAMARFEERIYRGKGLVTYMADRCLLDIFTDTTERSPTFMLPRFRKRDDETSPPSWAFVKNPLLGTTDAWRDVLCRAPRCLDWDVATYRRLDAPASLQQNPPALTATEMFKFGIGSDDDPSRYATAENAAILVTLGGEPRLCAAFPTASRPFRDRAVLAVGQDAPPDGLAGAVWHVPLRLTDSPLHLWDRLAVKLALNTVSTATMARMGRLASNWMAHVEPTNKKLIDRGTRLVAEIAGVDYATACYALHETIEDLARSTKPGQEKPSPVAQTILRLRGK